MNILLTGATGYIGSQIARKLVKRSSLERNCFLLPVRNKKKCEEILGDILQLNSSDFHIREMDITKPMAEKWQQEVDYIIHCACPTKSSYMISHPVETAESIVDGTKQVLELARRKNVKSMIYLSSMEVYGKIDCLDGRRISEDETGTLDILNARSCYPQGKRMAENLCYAYFSEYNVPVKIARLSQTFGYGILPEENRIFAQFAAAVRGGKNIVLHTDGNSIGNYCEIQDTVEAILCLLEKGQNGEAYNVVNEENTMTIRKMAEMVAEKIAGGKIKVIYDIPENNIYGYAQCSKICLSAQKIEALGWKPTKNLEIMYRDMLDGIKE